MTRPTNNEINIVILQIWFSCLCKNLFNSYILNHLIIILNQIWIIKHYCSVVGNGYVRADQVFAPGAFALGGYAGPVIMIYLNHNIIINNYLLVNE